MSTAATTTFRLAPIDPATADALRVTGDQRYVADSKPGYPCRQCLRDADVGDELILVSHDPFTIDSPYRSSSPIFLHLEPCGAPEPADELPVQLTGRQLSVRAFDAGAMMVDAALIDGADLQATIERFFATTEAANIHVHNAVRGCWAVTIERA